MKMLIMFQVADNKMLCDSFTAKCRPRSRLIHRVSFKRKVHFQLGVVVQDESKLHAHTKQNLPIARCRYSKPKHVSSRLIAIWLLIFASKIIFIAHSNAMQKWLPLVPSSNLCLLCFMVGCLGQIVGSCCCLLVLVSGRSILTSIIIIIIINFLSRLDPEQLQLQSQLLLLALIPMIWLNGLSTQLELLPLPILVPIMLITQLVAIMNESSSWSLLLFAWRHS